jgi:hypothetical protein
VLYHHPTGTLVPLDHYGYGGAATSVLANGLAAGWVGYRVGDSIYQHAAFWNQNGDVGLLPGSLPSWTLGLNASLTFATASATSGPRRVSRVWADGREELLAFGDPWAAGIDAQHRVWGFVGDQHVERMRVWDVDERVYEPPSLGPTGNRLYAVNAAGVAAGSHESGTGSGFKILATRVTLGGTTGLPSLGGDAPYCYGFAINAHGDVGGACGAAPFPSDRAVLWPYNGAMVDLSRTVSLPDSWQFVYVNGISDDGVLVAAATQPPYGDGPRCHFLLTPLPAVPMVALAVNQASFAPGQTLTATITTQDAAGLDLYLGAILTDGDQLMLATQMTPLQGQVVRLSTTTPAVFPKVAAGPRPTQVFSYTFTGLEAPGTYHLVAALVPPGAFNDGIIHGEDLVGFDWKAISLTVTPLHAKMLAFRDKHMGR